jgi:hypothetical protein
MKLREFKFNDLKHKSPPALGLSIHLGEKKYTGFIGEVLKEIPLEFADYEIENESQYFDIYVIHLKQPLEVEE